MEDDHADILFRYSEQLESFVCSRNTEENALLEQLRQMRNLARTYKEKYQQAQEQCQVKDARICELEQRVADLEKPTVNNTVNGNYIGAMHIDRQIIAIPKISSKKHKSKHQQSYYPELALWQM